MNIRTYYNYVKHVQDNCFIAMEHTYSIVIIIKNPVSTGGLASYTTFNAVLIVQILKPKIIHL